MSALVRNPDNAERLKPLLGPQVVAVKGDVSEFDSFPVRLLYCVTFSRFMTK